MAAHTDLNLLRTLLTLIEEQSVSRTAERLFLSQSAVSKQLTKLRQQFNDPLFKRHPKGLKLTPRARILEPKLRHWLALSEEIIEPQGFNPSTSQRQFRIALNETSFVTLLPKFLAPLWTGKTLMATKLQSDYFSELFYSWLLLIYKHLRFFHTIDQEFHIHILLKSGKGQYFNIWTVLFHSNAVLGVSQDNAH